MFESVSSALDAASQMLAGGAAAPGASADATPKYTRGKDLDTDKSDEGASRTANLENTHDAGEVIEFIHFGFVHTSRSHNFVHPKYKDNEEVKIGAKDKPRAIQFRSALERETLLLSVFMEATQTLLQERADSKGALGSVMNALGSVTGLGGGGSGGIKPSDVNSHIQKVADAAKKLDATPAEYKTIHQTGMDLHQARANYRELLRKIVEEPPPKDAAGGLMGAMAGSAGLGAEMGKIISLVQGIAFKPLDIKVKFQALLARQQEQQVETACSDMTLKALEDALTPFLPVWFPKDREKWDAPANPVSRDGGLLSPVTDAAAGAVDSGRKEVAEKANKVKDFFEADKTDAPGEPFLSEAFKTAAPSGKDSEPMPMETGKLACQAFVKALGLDSLPGFVEGIVKTIVAINLDLLHGALGAVLGRDPGSPIAEDDLYDGARQRMLHRLLDLAMDKLTFLKTAKEFELNAPMGYSVKPGDLADKGMDKLDELIKEKIGGVVDAPLKYAMGSFATQLELARQQGTNNKCHTMELYLGRLPWMEATLFYNIFFPFWDAFVDLMYHVLPGPAGGALKAAVEAAKKAKGVTDFGRDALKKANAIKEQAEKDRDRLSQGVDLIEEGKKAAGGQSPLGAYDKAMGSKADETKAPKLDEGKFVFPLKNRKLEAEGKDILKDEYDQVKDKDQWESADNPPAEEKDEKEEKKEAAKS